MKAMQGLQQGFQQAVLARSSANELFTPVQLVEADVGGFNIYANAYRVRLAAALADNYPILRLALGDDMFDALTSAHIEQHPSTYRSIRWYGDQLAMFMEAHSTLMPHPALADLARMDWALRLSFDAADDDRLVVGDLAQLSPDAWETQCFTLRAPVMLQYLQWNIETVWQALNSNPMAETSPPEALEHTLLIWRDKLDCNWRSLTVAEAAGLKALADGSSFATICEQMMAADQAITHVAAATALRQWVEHGLLAKA